MTRCFALVAAIAVAAASAGDAAGQATAIPRGTPKRRPPIFNPFGAFTLNRFTLRPFGFVQLEPLSPFERTAGSATAGASSTTAALSSPAPSAESEGDIPLAAAIRPPYRPPVRSPYRPPSRPPF